MTSVFRDKSFMMGIFGCLLAFGILQIILHAPLVRSQADVLIAGQAPASQLTTVDAPRLIPFQAYLTDAAGRPVEGQRNLTFKLYDMPESGSDLGWTETHTNIPVNKGMVNVLLGSVIPFGNLAFDASRYIGMSIDGGMEMVPRQQVIPAIHAADSDRSKSVGGSPSGLFTNSVEITPIGGIMPWFGNPVTLPSNWMLCDGRTISDPASPLNGMTVPDMRGRFIRGEVNSTRDIPALSFSSGGKDSDAWAIATHVHTITADSAGSHSHSINSSGSHDHRWMIPSSDGYTWRDDGNQRWNNGGGYACPGDDGDNRTSSSSFYTESNGSHSHTSNAAGSHSHTGSTSSSGAASGTIQTVPSYIALHYIIRIK